MEGAVRGLESGVVTGRFGESAFIVSDVQVKHSSAGTTCELLSDLFGEGSDAGMLDRTVLSGSRLWMGRMASASFFAMQNQ